MNTDELEFGGLNAPRREVDTNDPRFDDHSETMIYQARLDRNTRLECLAIKRGNVPTVVSFHGALLRKKYILPRFEWLSTLQKTPYNVLFFSDPSLLLHKRLELAWFTGWAGLDLHRLIAKWANIFAENSGSKKVVLAGSSGGGFAALQTAPHVRNSTAVVFNPQTQLDAYLVGGRSDGLKAQTDYLRAVYPELIKKDGSFDPNWARSVGDKASALEVYKKLELQKVHYWTAPNDFHHQEHYVPFVEAYSRGVEHNHLQTFEYDARPGHRPPSHAIFKTAIEGAISDSR